MPAPSSATYSAAAKIAAHTSFLTLVDSGPAAGKIKIRDASDVLLVSVPLDDPGGTVNGTTGQLVFDIPASVNASTSGTAAYGEITNSTDTVYLALPAQQGTAAVSGYIVLNSLTVVAGSEVTILSAAIG